MNNELNSITILEMSSLTKERPRTNFYTRAVYTPKKTKDNEKTTIQNLWDDKKTVLGKNFMAMQTFLKKEEKSQIDNLTHHLKESEKEEQTNPKVSRRKEIIKIREEINKIGIQRNDRKYQ